MKNNVTSSPKVFFTVNDGSQPFSVLVLQRLAALGYPVKFFDSSEEAMSQAGEDDVAVFDDTVARSGYFSPVYSYCIPLPYKPIWVGSTRRTMMIRLKTEAVQPVSDCAQQMGKIPDQHWSRRREWFRVGGHERRRSLLKAERFG